MPNDTPWRLPTRRTRRVRILVLALALAGAGPLAGARTGALVAPLVQATGPATPPPDAEAAIRAALAVYAQAWYEGNAPRLAGVLHPEFTRQVVVHAPDAPDTLETRPGLAVLDECDRGLGRATAPSARRADVAGVQVAGGLADASLRLADRTEHVRLALWNHAWRVLGATSEREAAATGAPR